MSDFNIDLYDCFRKNIAADLKQSYLHFMKDVQKSPHRLYALKYAYNQLNDLVLQCEPNQDGLDLLQTLEQGDYTLDDLREEFGLFKFDENFIKFSDLVEITDGFNTTEQSIWTNEFLAELETNLANSPYAKALLLDILVAEINYYGDCLRQHIGQFPF